MHTSYFDSADIRHVLPTFNSPQLILDAEIVRKQMYSFQQALPHVTPFYSVKTNPHPLVIDTLNEFKAHFDAATIGEITMLLDRGVEPGGILYTHPVKTVDEITAAATLDINAYTFDSLDELKRLSQMVPRAHLFLRLSPTNNASLYDYKRKFGAGLQECRHILDHARDNGLNVSGISFMVGSQSMKLDPWHAVLQHVLDLFHEYHKAMPSLRIVNIGSGFPLPYAFDEQVPSLGDIAQVVNTYQAKFPVGTQFIAEPGRYICGPAAVFKTKVARRLERGGKRWLYTDVNAYSGLIEIIEGGGKFPYRLTSDAGGELVPFMVSGKTLDPDDTLGHDTPLPAETTEGNVVTVWDAGAYSTSFFTDYHSLPHPSVVTVDSKYTHNVSLATGTMGISGLQANKAFAPGELLFQVSGYFVNERTRTTFQVDVDKHIEPTLFGAFLNHSCDPNVGVRTNEFGYYDVIARRPITAGEDIAADYAMFEYETGPMSLVPCLCGSPMCRRRITGYKDLPAKQRATYKGLTAAYLVQNYAHQTGSEPVFA